VTIIPALSLSPIHLNGGHRYRRAPPSLAGCWSHDADLLAYFYNIVRQREVECPAEYMLHFERAYVYDGQYALLAERGWLAPSITDYNAADRVGPGLQQAIAAGNVHRLPYAGKPTVMIAKAGALNYGHVLAEILPKLLNIARSPLREIRLLLPAGMTAYGPIIQLLNERLGIRADLVFDPPSTLTEVEELFYIGPVSQHNVRKSATLLALRDLLWRCLDISPAPRRKFYIDRPEAESRSITNAAEVSAILTAFGYERVTPGSMSLADQAALFAQASHIAGPLGAGLANILFAPAQCRVMMIDPGLADYFFWDLAALAGQPFTWMFTGPVKHFTPELSRSRYPVDLNGLRYALTRLD
jgi:hypothetical protein